MSSQEVAEMTETIDGVVVVMLLTFAQQTVL
jgi:hypothetical protein